MTVESHVAPLYPQNKSGISADGKMINQKLINIENGTLFRQLATDLSGGKKCLQIISENTSQAISLGEISSGSNP